MRYDESAVIGVLGGGYGEPPVRVADLEEAARRTAARRAAAREPTPAPVPDEPASIGTSGPGGTPARDGTSTPDGVLASDGTPAGGSGSLGDAH
ncbi:hypothetical protein [Catellatospora sp. NPDC049133]|uniref:hypothetical protein n=1 Tax=Catellatospora sp. NPDC049133 TaxID=3155499 RepID=UPI0033F4A8C2